MEQEHKNQNDSVFSRKIRAGRRRTYFFDVRMTKAKDYYLTITESKKRMDNNGYERHKVFIYKEDFNKFLAEMTEAVNFIKSKMPDFDFDSFSHVYEQDEHRSEHPEPKTGLNETTESNTDTTSDNTSKIENAGEMENPTKNTDNEDHEDLRW